MPQRHRSGHQPGHQVQLVSAPDWCPDSQQAVNLDGGVKKHPSLVQSFVFFCFPIPVSFAHFFCCVWPRHSLWMFFVSIDSWRSAEVAHTEFLKGMRPVVVYAVCSRSLTERLPSVVLRKVFTTLVVVSNTHTHTHILQCYEHTHDVHSSRTRIA